MKNSTSGNEWSSIVLKWSAPEKHPAGKITIRYSGPKPRQSIRQVEELKLNWNWELQVDYQAQKILDGLTCHRNDN